MINVAFLIVLWSISFTNQKLLATVKANSIFPDSVVQNYSSHILSWPAIIYYLGCHIHVMYYM